MEHKSLESKIIDKLGMLAPWACTALPAFLTYYHVLGMGFPGWMAFLAAFAAETLGIVSIHTIITFQEHNRKYAEKSSETGVWISYGFYLFIIVMTNIMLEIVKGTRSGWEIAAIALFALMSIPGGLLVSKRAQYKDMLERRAEQKRKTNETRKVNKEKKAVTPPDAKARQAYKEVLDEAPKPTVQSANFVSDENDYRRLTDGARMALVGKTTKEIREMYPKLSERTAAHWKEYSETYGKKSETYSKSETFR